MLTLVCRINFSIFGTTPEELAAVQHEKYQDRDLAAKRIASLHQAIDTASDAGIRVGGNIVMSDGTHEERVLRVIKGFNEKLGVRILPDLDRGMESYAAIYDLLAGLQARPLLRKIDAGSSNMKITYGLPDGREVHFKQILANRIKECETCPLNNPNDCKEGYYGVRLYVDKQGVYKVGVCLQRMDLVLPVVEFVKSNLCSDILNHRAAEFKRLQSLHAA